MAEPRGVMGAKLYISSATIASTIDSEREFMGLTWNEIGYVSNVSQHGITFQDVPFTVVGGRVYHLKGAYDYGPVELQMALDLSDAGQLLLKTAAESVSQDHYGFRIDKTDAPSSVGGPTMVMFRGLAQSFVQQMGDANTVAMVSSRVAINGEEIDVDPAELYDRFTTTGGTLAHYTLFNGTDPEALAPYLADNVLYLVSGNANTGLAADGSQLIGDTGYTLSGGALVFQARIASTLITNLALFVGFTDQVAALENPIYSAAVADTITTDATDAVGFMFDTGMATDNFWLVGVNNNVDETAQNSAIAPVSNTYVILRVEIATNGDAVFSIDGTVVGTTMTTACRTTVPLYPTICVNARSTVSKTVTVDELYVRQG